MARNIKKEIEDILYEVKLSPEERRRMSSPRSFEKVVASIKASNDAHVIQLFKYVNRSYRDPWAWYALLGVLAQALFESHKRGRRPKHKKPSDPVLVRDFRKVAETLGPNKTARRVCSEMIKMLPAKYGSVPAVTLNTWVSKAGAVKEFKNTRQRIISKTSLKK